MNLIMLSLPRCHQLIRWVSYDQNWYPDSYIGYTSSSGMRGMLCFWKKKKISLIPIKSKSFSWFSFWGECLVSVILVQFSQIPRAIYLNAVVLQNINLHNSRPIIFMVPTRRYQFNFFTFFRKFISMGFFLTNLQERSLERKYHVIGSGG